MPGIFFIAQNTVRASHPKVTLLPTQSWGFPGMLMLKVSCICSICFALLLSIGGARMIQSVHAGWLWIWRQSIIQDYLGEIMKTMASVTPLHWKWILSYASWWCQVPHAPAFYFARLSPPSLWPNSQLQIALGFEKCAAVLTYQQFKVMVTKISTKKLCLLFFSHHASMKSPGWYTVTSRQVDGMAKRNLCSVELSLLCTLAQHSTVCTCTNWKAWSAKNSCSMSGICCLMSSRIKPHGRDESSKPLHQPRLLYSNSH